MVAGISAPRQYFNALHSWENMKRRPGDKVYHQAINIGEVGRQIAVEKFLESKEFDAIFMCDLDQEFPMDALEMLRTHDKDMVSGHYMQRRTSTLKSNWQYTVDGDWPYLPYLYDEIPRTGMHRIANTGLGCALIKREPIVAVKKFLDHWEPNSNPFEIGKIPELDIRYGNFGSDYRFFFYAQRLGFELWGDADVETPHAASIWLTRDIHNQFLYDANKDAKMLNEKVFLPTIRSYGVVTLNAAVARKKAILGALGAFDLDKGEQRDYDVLQGQLLENQMWIDTLSAESPPPGFVTRWHRDPQPALDDAPVKFPTFKSREELDEAVANPERDIEGQNPEQLKADRTTASRNGAMSAAETMNRKNSK
jgi:hypothetical protein